MSIQPFVTPGLTGGVAYTPINHAFRYFTLISITPTTANVQARVSDRGQSQGTAQWFPLSLTNPTRLKRHSEDPFGSLEIKSDTTGTVVTGVWSDTDEYIPSCGDEDVTVLGFPLTVLPTFSGPGGGVLYPGGNDVGLASILITLGMGTTGISGNITLSSGTTGSMLNVFDQNKNLVSQNGQIPFSALNSNTSSANASSVFYVDMASLSNLEINLPTPTGGGTPLIQASAQAGPIPSSEPLNRYPAPTLTAPAESGIFSGKTLIIASLSGVVVPTTILAGVPGTIIYVASQVALNNGQPWFETASESGSPGAANTIPGSFLISGSASAAVPYVLACLPGEDLILDPNAGGPTNGCVWCFQF